MPEPERLIRVLLNLTAVLAIMLSTLSCSPGNLRETGGKAPPPLDAAPKRVLIITGGDYPGHDWRATTPVLETALEADPRLAVDVLDDLASLGAQDLSPYAAVVLHFKNYNPQRPGRAGFDNLVRFVEDGGGMVLVHFACGAFEEFRDEYVKLVGRVWFGPTPPPGEHQHDPYGPFTVDIVDADHPITRGLQSFETTDELYTCLEGDVPIRVLAAAESIRDGRAHPIAFVLDDDESRVFHCVLGHDQASLEIEPVGELFLRGTAWAAGLNPAAVDPPPET